MLSSVTIMTAVSESGAVLRDTLVVFGSALAATLLARMVRVPSIIGFLAAGVAIGPWGAGLVQEQEVQSFAELGLVLLLFTVGLELSPAPVIQMGVRLVTATAFQMGITTAVVILVLRAFIDVSWTGALVMGVAVAPASTAIVLKQLSDRGQTEGVNGVISTGVLLLQDVLMVIAMLLLPLLAATGDASAESVLLRCTLGLIGLAMATFLARLAVPWVLRIVFRGGSREIMTLFAVVMAIGGALAAARAGWSPALGAAIAGLLLAATDFRHQLFAEIAPFREAFNALFFVAIGMLLDLNLAAEHAGLIAAAVAATLMVKSIIAAAGVAIAGWPKRAAIAVGVGLSTVSEFGYVLGNQAVQLGIVGDGLLRGFIVIAVGSMLAGAALVSGAEPLGHLFVKWERRRPDARGGTPSDPKAPEPRRRGHIVIVGYGLNGRNLANVLRSTGIPHCVIEMNPVLAAAARSEGFQVLLGDAARLLILEHAGLADARALVISISDQAATRRVVAQARGANRNIYILARTRFVTEIAPLIRLGANHVIPEEFETSIEIFAHVLKEAGVPENVIEQQITLVRAGHYRLLRGQPTDRAAKAEWLRLLELAATQTFMLPEQSPFAGRTLRDTDLRAKTGVTLVAITRSGQPSANPSPDLVLAAGDVLVLVGLHEQLDAAKRHLSGR